MTPLLFLPPSFANFFPEMEFQILSLPVIFSFIQFIFIVQKLGKKSKSNRSNPNLPPGPRKLPFIGNLHQLSLLPNQTLRNLARRYGPLMHLQLGEVSTVVISSPEMAKEVMKTHDLNFSSRPQIISTQIMSYNSIDIAFSPYGDYWRQLRKICTLELLSAKRVQSFKSIRDEEISNMIKSISASAGRPINLTEKIFTSTFGIISRAAFGEKIQEEELFISVVKETIKISGGFNVADLFPSIKFLHIISGVRPKLEKLLKISDRIMEKLISDHKSAKMAGKSRVDEDLLHVLLKYQDENLELPLSNDSIKAVILDIFGAGSETSATEVDWAMAEMMKNPRVMKKAQEEVRQAFEGKQEVDEETIRKLSYMKLVIKETLRLHPAVPMLLPRLCDQKCEINGYEIPPQTKVIVNGWAINRDPNHWTDPDTFNPERFLESSVEYRGTHFEYIPFGAGRRICPGITFGIANVEAQLAKLLFHFDWKLPYGMSPEDLDMSEQFGASVRRKENLELIPIPYEQFINSS